MSLPGDAPSQLVPHTRKIAVLRANALGDFIFSLPALYALRAAYPKAEIVLLGKAWHADFLESRPGPVSRVAVVPRWRGVSQPDTWTGQTAADSAAADRFFAQMAAEGFDLALQMHGGGRHSNPFVQRLGARVTAGLRSPDATPLDRWVRYEYFQHEALRLIEVARLVGAPSVMIEPRIEVTHRDRVESCEVVPEQARPLAILHPGASDPRRRWPVENFAAVGDALAREGYTVAVIGIDAERQIVDAVIENMQQPALNLCGLLSLHALTGLIARAELVIANDSGPRHLAEAVGTPTVGIYWCGNGINAGSVFREFHRPHLSWRLNCPVCGRDTIYDNCDHQVPFVDLVRVDEVLQSALDILKMRHDRKTAPR